MLNFNTQHAGTTIRLPGNSNITLAWCPAGNFRMGAHSNDKFKYDNEYPQANVYFRKGFWIGITPVTIKQYCSMLGNLPGFMNYDENLPVVDMQWDIAKKFCNVLSKKLQEIKFISEETFVDLPTEAQWEYACRAGTDSIWHFGNELENLTNYAWYKENSDKTFHPVAQKLPNQWGIYDMYGNVSEWTLGNFYLYKLFHSEKPSNDPLFEFSNSTTMVVRGGGFRSPAKLCRSSTRSVMDKDNPYNDEIGFRVVINSNVERTYYDNNMDNRNRLGPRWIYRGR